MCQPPFNPRKIHGTHFRYRLSLPQGHSGTERIRSIEKSNDLFRNQTCNLPACCVVSQPTTLLSAPTAMSFSTSKTKCCMLKVNAALMYLNTKMLGKGQHEMA
jgi:hypothetical protein